MYNKPIYEFINDSEGNIYSQIDHSVDNSTRTGLQKWAWDNEISYLRNTLKEYNGQIIFEYSIPRLGKRIDTVVLINNIIFVLEFKVGKKEALKTDKKQTIGYAQALRWYHSASANHIIVPILITTEGKTGRREPKLNPDDQMYDTIVVNNNDLQEIINKIITKHPAKADKSWEANWAYGRYNPTPSIIEATRIRYINNNVKEIRESGASAQQLTETTQYIIERIKDIKVRSELNQTSEKAIFFVTGVPGAGKTLIGLDLVADTQSDFNSVFLSGNKPLVDVLLTALKEDSRRLNKLNKFDDIEELNPDAMIQLVHKYRSDSVKKIEDIDADGTLIIKEHLKKDAAEVEHVVVFDEAQRAWNREKLMKPGRSGNKTILQHPRFPYSEPAFLLWSLNLRKDWVAVVCLVGGGQEINTGEAGILEWIKAVRDHFKDNGWRIYLPDTLKEPEYAGDDLEKVLAEIPQENIERSNKLHLTVSRRSLRAERVSDFVKSLLDGNVEHAKELYREFSEKFPIVLTRDIDTARKWLRDHRGTNNGRQDKIGMLMSSRAFRLRPFGFDIKKVGEYTNVGDWFLKDENNIESSDFLEVALNEFFVQGLELDWAGVIWDADFRSNDNNWDYYNSFSGNKWGAFSSDLKNSANLSET